MSTPRSPFTTIKQEKFKQLLQEKLPSLNISYDEFIDWLVSYIRDEDFYHIDTIRQDLLDITYSDIKTKIQSEYEWDDKTLQIITNILLNDIFPGYNTYSNNGNRGSIIINEEEETKVFYPTDKRRESDNELALAFAETIGGFDQFSPPPIDNNNNNNNNNKDNNNEETKIDIMDDMRSTSHIHDHEQEITPNPNMGNRSQRDSYELDGDIKLSSSSPPPSVQMTAMQGAMINDIDHLKANTMRRLESRWADGEEIDPIEDECNDDEYPWHLNVALFHRSDDESLELLIDKAVLEICYAEKFKDLWQAQWFIKSIYSDKLFPKAVDKVYDLIDEVCDNKKGKKSFAGIEKKKKLGFIGNFVDTHFERQIKEYKRRIEGRKDDDEHESGQPPLSSHESVVDDEEKKIQSYLVYHIDGKYIIQQQRLPHKQKIMTLDINDDPKYSWSVWKKSTKLKKDNIKSKGYWEILEREDEKKHSEKRRKDLEQFAGQKLQTSSHRLPFGKLSAVSTLKVIKTHTTTTNSSSQALTNHTSSVTNNSMIIGGGSGRKRKSKFLYVPLNHLQLIFQLMQKHYGWSIQGEVEKKDFEKTNGHILDTPFYARYCAKQQYECRTKESDPITIEGIRYRLIWWNFVGQKKCNSFCIQIGDDDREYYYLRFKNDYKRFRWDWYGMYCL